VTELLVFLQKLLPLWAVAVVFGVGYLIVLLKKASGAFLDIAKQQADFLKDRLEVVDKSTGIFARTIDQQEKEIKGLREHLERLGADVHSTRETDARLSIHELTVISQGIEKLSTAQVELRRLITQSPARLPTSTPTASAPAVVSVRAELDRAIKARDLSIYPILVLSIPGAALIVERLQRAGYAASLYESKYHRDDPDDAQEGIWVGAMMPPGNAIEAIQIARREWPRLKYVHLSTDAGGPEDTHYTMFIGGSSHAALGHLGCLAWSENDFEALAIGMSFDELHSFIKQRYRAERVP